MPRDIEQIAKIIAFEARGDERNNGEKLLNYMKSLNSDHDNIILLDNISKFLQNLYASIEMVKKILSPLLQNDKFTDETLASIMKNIRTEYPEDYEKIILDTNKKETPVATILEEQIEPKRVNRKKAKATVSETLNEKAHHPLTYLLNRMTRNKSSYNRMYADGKIEITDDKNGEEVKFENTVKKIGDKSVIEYKNDDKKIDNKITANTQTNTITLSHKKDTDINKYLVAHSITATIDYMKAKDEVPFILNIDGKTDTYINAAIETLFTFSDTYIAHNSNKRAKNEALNLRDNIASIKLGDITISNEIFSIKTQKEFEEKIKELKLKLENEKKKKKDEALTKATQELKQNNPNSQLSLQGNER